MQLRRRVSTLRTIHALPPALRHRRHACAALGAPDTVMSLYKSLLGLASKVTRVHVVVAIVLAALLAPLTLSLAAPSEFMGERMPYAAFDQLETTPIKVDGGVLHVGFAPGATVLPRSDILAWLEKSARAVSLYYGRFPVAAARVLIVPVDGRGVTGGQAFGYRGAAIRLMLGRDSTATDLTRDWKAVHEMVHLALPDVDDTHLWLAEGLAVYVESIARVQAGDLTPRKIWTDFVTDMPQGLPAAGDRGLDRTPTWGRRYWGGALFAFTADIEIRRRTDNRIGLQQALRAILAAGGNHEQDWSMDKIFATADAATGQTVLADMYAAWATTPVTPDLDALWKQLGVVPGNNPRVDGVTFDETAPLAATRRAVEGR